MSTAGSLFTPFADQAQKNSPWDRELVAAAGLDAWAAQFKLGTAGYRDLLDPDDLFNLEVPLNGLTLAIMLEARAQLAVETGLQEPARRRRGAAPHPGIHRPGRPDLRRPRHRRSTCGRRASAPRPSGCRPSASSTRNWTAARTSPPRHSQSYKGGWKPMDAARRAAAGDGRA